ncbi:benzyl alcohol O-benzoyltransferase-like isoform X2 [Prosopis cineraria]|uniref:benzyl alcohol O-benzoyltransferase-like isoform X2 n=1 Tax=Prosopis cineraria TaxID=364024 RepID=UPI002410ADC3|nr:benzyl alcohol O-benzoyltransferase-like isoform X2 [Prosopis cineraria]
MKHKQLNLKYPSQFLYLHFSTYSMAKQSHLDLVLNVRRQKPELISPAKLTPHEVKILSNIDDQQFLRIHFSIILFYRPNPSMAGKDPVKVIRDALAEALVFYYPLAGRLREGEGRKLMVECNGKGVMFIEADADVMLQQFGDDLQPPFPCLEDLLYSPPGCDKILHCPILLVTRLKCGGFIFGLRINHSVCDGYGILQFMNALCDIANGANEPLVLPVWHRELLNARDPPNVTCMHHEYDEVIDTMNSSINIVHRSFFFRSTEVSSLRRLLPDHLRQSSSSSEVITACLWRCRTKALQLDPHKEVRLMVVVNGHFRRNGLNRPLLPKGYYGNATVFPTAISTVGKLCESPLGYALELVRKAKAEVNDEYFHSVADLIATREPTCSGTMLSCMVSDFMALGFRNVDFGWGKAAYAGPAKTLDTFLGQMFYVGHTNSKGEEGRMVTVCLPLECMERFAKELDLLLNGVQWQIQESTSVRSKI